MKRCGMCGSTNLKSENIKGAHYPWRDHLFVELSYDQEVLVCQNCQNRVMSSKNIIELESNIRKSLWDKIKFAINKLTQEYGLSQEQLAEALGLTPQYISMVKTGKKLFSFTAFNLLQSYAEHPELIAKYTGFNLKANDKDLKIDCTIIGRGSVPASRSISHIGIVGMSKPDSKTLREIVEDRFDLYSQISSGNRQFGIYRRCSKQKEDIEIENDEHQDVYLQNLSNRPLGRN